MMRHFFKDSDFMQEVFDVVPSLMFIVDTGVRIRHLNATAASWLNAGRKDILLKSGGEALRCAHSSEGGCGRAAACRQCIIRNSVSGAFRGEHVQRKPARMQLFADAGIREAYFSVTVSPFYHPAEDLALLVLEDVTGARRTEEALGKSLREKGILLKEVHHRTKNNMHVISSLMSLQMNRIEDTLMKGIFREVQNRIHSMALAHNMLYESGELLELDLKDYLGRLARHILACCQKGKDIALRLEMDPAPISLYTALPCGLILNEFLSNSIKHAFPGAGPGEIAIRLKARENEIELSYSDNGVGLPEGFCVEGLSSLGMRIVNDLVKKQLQGNLEINRGSGLKAVVRFDKNLEDADYLPGYGGDSGEICPEPPDRPLGGRHRARKLV